MTKGSIRNSGISVAGKRNSINFPAPILTSVSHSLENGSVVARGNVSTSPAKSPVSMRIFRFSVLDGSDTCDRTGAGAGTGATDGVGLNSLGS